MKFKLNKKATLGFFAEPENEKEELVVKISDEMINKSSEALEKNKWRGWSTYEERQRGIDIVKEAIAPIVEKYKTELQDEEIFNMLYDHNEDNNYHTENTALQELLGKESLPQVSFTKQSDEQDYTEVTKKGYRFEQLSDEAKEKVKQWINQEDSWDHETYIEEFSWILNRDFKEYTVTIQDLDWDFDNYNRCTVDLKQERKYWPAFSNILTECAKQVLKDLPKFKDNPEVLEDWSREAASDMYYDGNGRFDTYSGLVDIDGYDGYGLSYKISDLCDDAYEEKIKPVLEQIRTSFEKVVQDHIDYEWSDEYVQDTCEANEYLFDENGNLI